MEKSLPSIPAKRYFTIGEVSELCGVKPYVLRYWEQEFTQLKPMKRRGNRRYYQHHEVLLIRRIRDLLYDQGFTISGARNQLTEGAALRGDAHAFKQEADAALRAEFDELDSVVELDEVDEGEVALAVRPEVASTRLTSQTKLTLTQVKNELKAIRDQLLF
ncbi:MAG TPA: MerR family transcriptional regulator [Burkholderiaceae bacterium]|jgi:DNA-binding transcriptional MerR regulator